MAKPSLNYKLLDMASNHETRSATDRLRDVYDAVEKALSAGVSRKAVHQALVDDGIAISLRHFDQALYRIRKSKRGQRIETGGPAIPHAEAPEQIENPKPKSPLTRKDFQAIRNQPMDLAELSRPVKR